MNKFKYYILLVLVTLIWGTTPAFGKLLVNAMSPLVLTGLRFAVIAGLLFSFSLITKQFQDFKQTKEVLFIAAFLGFFGVLLHNGFLFLGLHYTTATNTALIESIGPTMTTILAFLFIGERLTKLGFLGIFISCIGACTIISKGSLDVILNLNFNIGDLFILLCEFSWSCYIIVGLKANGKISTVALTAWSGLFGSIMCFIVGAFTNTLHINSNLTFIDIFNFSYVALASGLFCFVAWNYAATGVGASKAGSFIYIVPLTGAFIGVTFLGEPLYISQIIGGILVISGVVLTVKSKVTMKQSNIEDNILEKFPDLVKEHDLNIKNKES